MMEVTIIFRTPSRENVQVGATVHERTLAAVPAALAEQMAEDFVQYQSSGKEEQNKLYRYEKDGDEVLVALDFGEIIALTASES